MHYMHLDLASLDSVRSFAQEVRVEETCNHIDEKDYTDSLDYADDADNADSTYVGVYSLP